jgi:thioesterase domain-containing protein
MTADLDRIIPLTEGDADPLFCVHAVSGSAYSYSGLAQLLGPGQPVYGIEAPGFDDDREPVRSLPALSAEYAEAVQATQPEGELRLLGWSLGGVIAFDMAQRLSRAGRTVLPLILVDTGLPWIDDLPPEKEIQRRFIQDMIGIAGVSGERLATVFANYPDDVDAETMFTAVEQAGLLPEEFDAEVLAERFLVFRAHIEGLFNYEVTEPYGGLVIHLRSTTSPVRYMRWDRVTSNLTEHILAGDHHSIWTGDSLVRMSELVRQALQATQPQPH